MVLDRSVALTPEDWQILDRLDGHRRVIVANKCDAPPAWDPSTALEGHEPVCQVSSLTGQGCEALLTVLTESIGCSSAFRDTPRVTNERHIQLLRRCSASLERALAESRRLGVRAPEELLLFELGEARAALEEIAGSRTADDVLARIFERFCIGK
jgi:tRNA modification GTPase